MDKLLQWRFAEQQKAQAAASQRAKAESEAKLAEATKGMQEATLAAAKINSRIATTALFLQHSDAHGSESPKSEYFSLTLFKLQQQLGDTVEDGAKLLHLYEGLLGRGPTKEQLLNLLSKVDQIQKDTTLNLLELLSEVRTVHGEQLQQLRDEQSAATKRRKSFLPFEGVVRFQEKCYCEVNCLNDPFVPTYECARSPFCVLQDERMCTHVCPCGGECNRLCRCKVCVLFL